MPILITLALKYLLPALLISSLLGFGTHWIYSNGREAERIVWELKEQKQLASYRKELAEKQQELISRDREYQTNLAKMENALDEANKKRDADVRALSARGLYVRAKGCPAPDSRVSYAENTSPPSSGADRVRLSEEDERQLIAIANDAQRVVEQYNACRQVLGTLAEVVH